jgi:hypothetical protein
VTKAILPLDSEGVPDYELWDQGKLVGTLEIFEAPRVNGEEKGDLLSMPREY